jgi:hypothetical protein
MHECQEEINLASFLMAPCWGIGYTQQRLFPGKSIFQAYWVIGLQCIYVFFTDIPCPGLAQWLLQLNLFVFFNQDNIGPVCRAFTVWVDVY